MSKSIFSLWILGFVVGCGHASSSGETEDGLLRVYPQLVPKTTERAAAPVAQAEPVAQVAVAEPEPVPEPEPAPAPVIDETPSSLAVRVKGAKRCRVRVGNERFGKAPFADKPVPPGTHRIYVKCPRRPVYTEVLDFYPGEPQRVFLKKKHFKRRRVARN